MARAPFVLSFLLAGCTVDELSQSYQLDRLRILAVRATPAEPRPGETITLEAYTYDPEDHDLGILWFGCLPDSADEFGCTVDPSVLESLLGTDLSNLTKEEIAALELRIAGNEKLHLDARADAPYRQLVGRGGRELRRVSHVIRVEER